MSRYPGHDGFLCPYGVVGDRLWLREAWRTAWRLDKDNATRIADLAKEAGYKDAWAPIEYSADTRRRDWDCLWGRVGRQRLARFMPRWASRATLEVVSVRIERVQAIDEAGVLAEGLRAITKDGRLVKYGVADHDGLPGTDNVGWAWQDWHQDPRQAFRRAWEMLHGDGAWERNNWVWVLRLRKLPQAGATP